VSLQRIEKFLDEEEVNGQVSSLKRVNIRCQGNGYSGPAEFGFRNASFTWNSVLEQEAEKSKAAGEGINQDQRHGVRETDRHNDLDSISSTVVTDCAAESDDRRFELRGLNITFPLGELTIVTGPTASGKTALLVRETGMIT
jgi:ABC-type multidrug transport system fused ATPase/permease subunit